MSFDDWLTTEPVEVCYHQPCRHGNCPICEYCVQCDAEADEAIQAAQIEEAQNRFEIRP